MSPPTRLAAALWALAVGLSGLLGTAAPAPAQLVELGPEIRVAEGSPSDPAVEIAPDGRSAVVWREVRRADDSTAIWLQVYGSAGTPEGAPVEVVRVPHFPFIVLSRPDVAAGLDGSFLVVWRDDSVRCRTVGSAGTLGPETVLAEVPAFDQPPPVVARDPRGGFVAAWRVGSAEDRIVLRRLDGTCAPAGPERLVVRADDATRGLGRPVLSVGPAGGAVVLWPAEVRRGHFFADEIHGRWFAPDGSPVGGPVGLATGSSDRGVAATHLTDGSLLAAWVTQESSPPPSRLALQRFDASGRLLAEALVDPPVTIGSHPLLVPVVGRGALLALVTQDRGDAALVGQVVDASLTPAGEPFQISSFGGAGSPALASDGTSEAFAVWRTGEVSTLIGRRLGVATAGALGFAEPVQVRGEGSGSARIPVRRIGFAEGAVSVGYRTVGDTAEAGEDFQPVQGRLGWSDGDSSERTIDVPIRQDPDFEGPEVIRILLSDPTGGAVLGELREAQVVIEDDDGRPTPGRTPVPLTAEEVTCDRVRLGGLLERIELSTPASAKAAGLNLSFTASGDFAGIAYTGNGPVTAEHHLAFSTDPEVTPLLLNPERPQLPAVALARNPVNSDLVAPGDSDALEVRLRPTLGSEAPSPEALLVIDNLLGAGGRASQVKPGRGLAGLLTPCHAGSLVARDLHVLRVLSKVARLEVPGAARTELAIHRAPEIDAYGIDARAFDRDGRSLGTLVARITVTYTAEGELHGGELALVPPCPGGAAGGCTTLDRPGRLLLVHPTFTGELWTPTPYQVGPPASSAPNAVDLNWAELLAGTTWRRPN